GAGNGVPGHGPGGLLPGGGSPGEGVQAVATEGHGLHAVRPDGEGEDGARSARGPRHTGPSSKPHAPRAGRTTPAGRPTIVRVRNAHRNVVLRGRAHL